MMIEEVLNYEVDGVPFVSTIYRTEADEPAPGVLVFSDILGLGDHARERARWLADLGYVAFAMDLHGHGRVFEAPQALQELERFYADPTITLRRGDASLQKLREHPSVDPAMIGAVGYCYGGTLALEMVRSGQPIAALVGYHSVLTSSIIWDSRNLADKKILVCLGSEDPLIPEDQRHRFEAEMRSTSADWQLHLYGGVYHSFTDWRVDQAGVPELARYSPSADRRSWLATKEFFHNAFCRKENRNVE